MREEHQACPKESEHREQLQSVIGVAAAAHMRDEHLCEADARVSRIVAHAYLYGVGTGAFVALIVDFIVWRLW